MVKLHNQGKDFYNRSKSYYDRNAYRYEAASWYYFNKYKNDAVYRELRRCMQMMEGKAGIRVLEIGPGTGYLLGKLLSICRFEIYYTGVEHSKVMSNILTDRYSEQCDSFVVVNESVTAKQLQKIRHKGKYDFIMGSSILHHLLDYEQIIESLAGILTDGGVMYFVREPIHRDECNLSNPVSDVLEHTYSSINALLMYPKIRKYLWPNKVKAEDSSSIGYHMRKDGISTAVFRRLAQKDFAIVFMRKYNRRVSWIFSYLENEWLRSLRKDIFGNTLFSICLKRVPDTTVLS